MTSAQTRKPIPSGLKFKKVSHERHRYNDHEDMTVRRALQPEGGARHLRGFEPDYHDNIRRPPRQAREDLYEPTKFVLQHVQQKEDTALHSWARAPEEVPKVVLPTSQQIIKECSEAVFGRWYPLTRYNVESSQSGYPFDTRARKMFIEHWLWDAKYKLLHASRPRILSSHDLSPTPAPQSNETTLPQCEVAETTATPTIDVPSLALPTPDGAQVTPTHNTPIVPNPTAALAVAKRAKNMTIRRIVPKPLTQGNPKPVMKDIGSAGQILNPQSLSPLDKPGAEIGQKRAHSWDSEESVPLAKRRQVGPTEVLVKLEAIDIDLGGDGVDYMAYSGEFVKKEETSLKEENLRGDAYQFDFKFESAPKDLEVKEEIQERCKIEDERMGLGFGAHIKEEEEAWPDADSSDGDGHSMTDTERRMFEYYHSLDPDDEEQKLDLEKMTDEERRVYEYYHSLE